MSKVTHYNHYMIQYCWKIGSDWWMYRTSAQFKSLKKAIKQLEYYRKTEPGTLFRIKRHHQEEEILDV